MDFSIFAFMQLINGIKERELVERVQQGDQTAFELLFRFYYPGLVVYATQFTVDRSEAEEIVQDFFVRFWQKHSHIKSSESLKNYFFSCVKNSSLNLLKHKKIEVSYIQKLQQLSESENLTYHPDLFIVSELQEKIESAIALLPEKCREVFIMSRIQGLKNEEIASILDLSKRTVETQISKAIKVMRIELKDYLGLLFLLGISQF